MTKHNSLLSNHLLCWNLPHPVKCNTLGYFKNCQSNEMVYCLLKVSCTALLYCGREVNEKDGYECLIALTSLVICKIHHGD
jgi:hypothetical protein